jgi:predicted RNase H-like nuclease (RuvC/YqgF family)
MNKTSQIIARIKELFAEEKMATDYTAATGEIIRIPSGSMNVGDKVEQVIGGIATNLPDGQYLLDNGKSIVVEAGEIKDVKQPDATSDKPNEIYMEKEMTMGDYKDKMADYKNEIDSKLENGTEVKVLSKGDALSVGDMVLVKDAEGNFVKAPEGEHKLEGGLTIYTDERGFINELETKETEERDEADNEEMKTMFEAVSTIKSMVDELKASIKEMKDENAELKNRFNKFAAEPSVETIAKKPEVLAPGAKKEDKLKFFAKR